MLRCFYMPFFKNYLRLILVLRIPLKCGKNSLHLVFLYLYILCANYVAEFWMHENNNFPMKNIKLTKKSCNNLYQFCLFLVLSLENKELVMPQWFSKYEEEWPLGYRKVMQLGPLQQCGYLTWTLSWQMTQCKKRTILVDNHGCILIMMLQWHTRR